MYLMKSLIFLYTNLYYFFVEKLACNEKVSISKPNLHNFSYIYCPWKQP